MPKVKLTITRSRCRAGLHSAGEVFVVEDICAPMCHELWDRAYPMIYALLCGGELDRGDARAREFDVSCPDGGRVALHGELIP